MPTTYPRVRFTTAPAQASRLARDDEVYVMKQFANHAGHCSTCSRPYETYAKGRQLCERGQVYAKDVSQYIYCKGGKAFSTMDRQDYDQRVHIEIPRGCDVIRDLLKAVDKGMRLPKHKPVVAQEPMYEFAHVVERAPRPKTARQSYSAQPAQKLYIKGRGSLYKKDEAERQRRTVDEPIIIRAAPGVRVQEYHR